MQTDIEVERWLGEHGFGEETRVTARQVLEARGVTHPGKVRMSAEKEPRALEVLRARFALHCQSRDCIAFAQASGREPTLAETRLACERCGGSENARAAKELLETGLRRLVVVGGTPATREALERLLGHRLELRLVDGTHRRATDRARADLEWADRVLLWGATELHHKVSKQYADITATRHKVVHVPRRGIAQLLAGAVESMRRRAAQAELARRAG
jgi:hypothetical protein